MFKNPKAQKVYKSNIALNQAQLCSIDTKLYQMNGNSYQQALYTQFDKEKVCFIPFGFDSQYASIYVLYGYLLQEADLNLVRLSLVKLIQQILTKTQQQKQSQNQKGIVIVYFNSANTKRKSQKVKSTKKSKQIQFLSFKNQVVKNLQIKYLKLIKKIYVCHQGFIARSISSLPFSKFGLHNQLIECLIKSCNKLEDLVKCLGPLFQCQMIKQEVQEYNDSVQWLEIFSDIDKKMAKRKMIDQLGQQHQNPNNFYKKKITQYQLQYQTGIPLILNSLIKSLQNNQYYLQSQGIFRKACDPQKLKILQKQLIDCCLQQQVIRIANKYTADTIACCIKGIFNKLNPPVISYKSYDTLAMKMDVIFKQRQQQQLNSQKNKQHTFIQNQNYSQNLHEYNNTNLVNSLKLIQINPSNSNKFQLYHQQINQLLAYLSYFIQPNQKAILLRLIRFFKDSIIVNQRKNKMSAYNLSVVMGPCIFRPKKYGINDLMNSPRFASLMLELIKNPIKLQ